MPSYNTLTSAGYLPVQPKDSFAAWRILNNRETLLALFEQIGRISRWNGMCYFNSGIAPNVYAHSLEVADICINVEFFDDFKIHIGESCENEITRLAEVDLKTIIGRYAVLHDIPEAIFGDIPSPVKAQIGADFERIESRWDAGAKALSLSLTKENMKDLAEIFDEVYHDIFSYVERIDRLVASCELEFFAAKANLRFCLEDFFSCPSDVQLREKIREYRMNSIGPEYPRGPKEHCLLSALGFEFPG